MRRKKLIQIDTIEEEKNGEQIDSGNAIE